ncbi:MAG: hypothetical protein RL748_261, partial [Pseudomonadota bacterium]
MSKSRPVFHAWRLRVGACTLSSLLVCAPAIAADASALACDQAQAIESRISLPMLKQCADEKTAEVMFRLLDIQRSKDKQASSKTPRQLDNGDVFRKRQINELAFAVKLILTQGNRSDASPSERQAAASLHQGDPAPSIELLERSAKNGDPALARRAQAALLRISDLSSASKMLAQALALNPAHFEMLQAAADLAHIQRKTEAALALYQRMLDQARINAKAHAGHAKWQHQIATSLDDLADELMESDKLPQARQHYQSALDIWQDLHKAEPERPLWQIYSALEWNKLSNVAFDQNEFTAAISYLQNAQPIFQKLASAMPDSTIWPLQMIDIATRIGDAHLRARQLDAALINYKQALAQAARRNAQAPKDVLWQREMATSYQRIGDLYQFQIKGEEALAQYNAALVLRQKLAGPGEDNDGAVQGQIIFIQNRIADLQVKLGLPDAALGNYQAALALASQLVERAKLEDFTLVQANLMGKIGLLEDSDLKPEERHAMMQRSVKLLEAASGKSPLPQYLAELMEKLRTA